MLESLGQTHQHLAMPPQEDIIDFNPLIRNQIQIISKAQAIALVELNEKTTAMLQTHTNILLDLDSLSESFWDDDGWEDEPIAKPDPVIGDYKY